MPSTTEAAPRWRMAVAAAAAVVLFVALAGAARADSCSLGPGTGIANTCLDCVAQGGCGWCQTTQTCGAAAGNCSSEWYWTGAEPCWNQSRSEQVLFLAYAAYCPQDQMLNFSCKWCQQYAATPGAPPFTPVAVINNTHTQTWGYVGYAGRHLVVAFRGTEDLRNWITDLWFPPVAPYPAIPSATVHRGFLEAYQSVQDDVRAAAAVALQRCGAACDTALFTGHSLGAALTTVACADFLVNQLLPPGMAVQLQDFGSPRVGNPGFADWLQPQLDVTWRMTWNRDVVPHLPTEVMGFHHLATEVWWNSTAYRTCNTSGEDPTCSDGQVDDSIPDHLNYMDYPCCC